MKKGLSIFVFIWLLAAGVFAQPSVSKTSPQEKGCNFKIQVNGLHSGVITLGSYYAEKTVKRDSAVLNGKGVAVFNRPERFENGLYFIIMPDRSYFELVIDSDQEFEIITDTSYRGDYYPKMRVVGSAVNQRYVDYQKFLYQAETERGSLIEKMKDADKQSEKFKQLQQSVDELGKKVMAYKQDYIKNYDDVLGRIFYAFEEIKAPENMADTSMEYYLYYKAHFWDHFNFSEEAYVRAPANLLKKRIDFYFDKLVVQHPDSLCEAADRMIQKATASRELEKYFIWYLTSKYQTTKIMCFEDVFVHMAQKYYCTGRAYWADTGTIRKMCEETSKMMFTKCNGLAPNLRMADTAGVYHELYRLSASYTILIFWDPTCSHCKKVVPMVNDVYQKFKQYGVRVYAVSTENQHSEWLKYMKAHPEISEWTNVCKTDIYYPWPIYKYNYNIIANPTVFILDKDKNIIARKINEENMMDFVEYRLKEDGLIKETDSGVPPVNTPETPSGDKKNKKAKGS